MTHYNGHLPLAKQALADSIYACELPIKQQPAYRHYQVMEKLVKLSGVRFQKEVRQLKRKGTLILTKHFNY